MGFEFISDFSNEKWNQLLPTCEVTVPDLTLNLHLSLPSQQLHDCIYAGLGVIQIRCFYESTDLVGLGELLCCGFYQNTNIEIHTVHTSVSWPNHKQWVIVHTSDLMMIIKQSIYILSIITRGVGKLNTHSPTYCIMDNWENILNLTHTLGKISVTGIL